MRCSKGSKDIRTEHRTESNLEPFDTGSVRTGTLNAHATMPVFVEALYGFELSASYIPTKANDLADDLSRNNLSSFLCKVPALKGKSSRSIAGDPDRHIGGLDVMKLDASLQGYFHRGLAPSTHRSYDCALRRFNSFCMQYNVSDPFPVTEKLLCYFSTKLADDGLAPQTITSPQFEACSYP